MFFVISDRLQVANLFPVKLFLFSCLVQEEPGSSDCSLCVLKFTNHKLFIIKHSDEFWIGMTSPACWFKLLQKARKGERNYTFSQILWWLSGVEVRHFHIFSSHTGVETIPIFQRHKKASKLPHICSICYICSEYPPCGCLSIFWKGYWVYGVLFR